MTLFKFILFLLFSSYSLADSFGDFIFISKCGDYYCVKGEYQFNQTVTLIPTGPGLDFCSAVFGEHQDDQTLIKDFSNCFDEFNYELAIVGQVSSFRIQALDSTNDRDLLSQVNELLDAEGIKKSFIVYRIDNLTSIYLVHLNNSNNEGFLYQLHGDRLTKLSDHCAKIPSLIIIRGKYYLLTKMSDCEQGYLGKELLTVSRTAISKVLSETP